MVKLEAIPDEHFTSEQLGPDNDEDYYTDTDSSISTDSDNLSPASETLTERILALRDIIPPKQRNAISNTLNTTYSFVSSGLLLGGKTMWVISTSALLFGVPWALAFSEEAQIMEVDRERSMQADVNEVLTPGASQEGRPAL